MINNSTNHTPPQTLILIQPAFARVFYLRGHSRCSRSASHFSSSIVNCCLFSPFSSFRSSFIKTCENRFTRVNLHARKLFLNWIQHPNRDHDVSRARKVRERRDPTEMRGETSVGSSSTCPGKLGEAWQFTLLFVSPSRSRLEHAAIHRITYLSLSNIFKLPTSRAVC